MKSATKPNYMFKQKVFYEDWLITAQTTDTYQGLVFSLGQIGGNLAPFQALYDQYKIGGVKIQLIPKSNSYDGTTVGSLMPQVISCIDYDSIPPTDTLANVMQYQNVKMTSSNRTHSRYLKPRFVNLVDNTTTPGYQTNRGWIDCANATVDHNGVKIIVPKTPGQNLSYDLIVTYYLKFKNVR